MPASASSTPLQTFSLFPNLAPELRLKIWSHACFPRTLTLRYTLSNDAFASSSPAPAILSTSHEARTEALRNYKLSFGTKTKQARIYFNPWRDTLYLPRCREMGYDETLRDFRELVNDEGREIFNEVNTVAIDHVDVDIKRPWESYNKASFIRSFRNLSEVVLVVGEEKRPGLFKEWLDEEDEAIKEGVEFVQPRVDPELLLRFWAGFRQSFVTEERLLEDVCRAVGREYGPFSLPAVRIMSKIPKRKAEETVL